MTMNRIRPASPARLKELRRYRTMARKFIEQHPRCEGCGKQANQIHHKRGRSGKLLCDVRFWLTVCAKCHECIHWHPDAARRAGLLCEKGKWGSSD